MFYRQIFPNTAAMHSAQQNLQIEWSTNIVAQREVDFPNCWCSDLQYITSSPRYNNISCHPGIGSVGFGNTVSHMILKTETAVKSQSKIFHIVHTSQTFSPKGLLRPICMTMHCSTLNFKHQIPTRAI